MDKGKETAYLFEIGKAIKHFYETPVIFLTKKDYSDNIFNTMCTMRSLIQEGTKAEIIDIIAEFHLQWLHAVNELENFVKGINEFSREDLYQAISFTIDAMSYRLKYYQKYMQKYLSSLTNIEQSNLLSDIEIVEDMHKDVIQNLLEQLKCFRNYIDNNEFILKVKNSVDELLQWLDKIYDELALILCHYISACQRHLSKDLTKNLQQIVKEMQDSETPSAHVLIEQLNRKGVALTSMTRDTAVHDLEISKVKEKISVLEDRIQRLEHEPLSAALMALQHKKEFLVKRMASLQRLSLPATAKKYEETGDQIEIECEDDVCTCKEFYRHKIFNHLLPLHERERLVRELCFLWDSVVFGEESHKSIISILSAADMKEEFTDELGTFFIDEYSRKVYKMPDDDTLYQPNEMNELVPLSDDAEHIYFYDECGRYFNDATRQRVYKAHATASEYMMDSFGLLLKSKEEKDGMTFFYDNYGRYYVNDQGKHIYRDPDSTSEYENDGLGNLVRIRSQLDLFRSCPDDVNVTKDFNYLKITVGSALRECIADVILHQPADPIKYLSLRLIKYRENMELKDKRASDKAELNAEREIKIAEEKAALERAAMDAAFLTQGGSEASYDSNLLNYTSMHQDDIVSVD